MRQKIADLFDEVEKIEEVSKRFASNSHNAANEVSGGLASSYSAAGDVEHARNTANLSIQKHKAIKNLEIELKESIHLESPKSVEPVCYIKITMSGNEKEIYLVNNPVYIAGFNLISPNSPMGEAILGNKVGDLFLYKNSDQTFTGKILEIG